MGEAFTDVIIDAMADGIIIIDEQGIIERFNPAAEHLFGYSACEIIGTCISCLMPAPYRQEHDQYLARYLATGERRIIGIDREVMGRRKDGSTFPMYISVGERQLTGRRVFVGIVHDLTERQQAQALRRANQALIESEARFKLMAEAAPVMIWLSEPDRICTYFNRAWLEFTGRTLEQELAHDWVDDVHPEDRVHCLTVYTAAFEARAPFRVEYRLRRHDGVHRWVLDSGRPRYLPDGGFAGYISAGLDITERKEADLRLARAYEELEERTADLSQVNAELRRISTDLARSNTDLEQFAYVASHDLQEPLRAVAGCVQLLQQRYQGQLDARADEYIRHAVEGAKRMQQLINDLLTYSRITTQAQPLTPTDSGAVLQAVLQSLASALEESGAVVNTGALPAVMGDPTQLTQLFQNLVSNALKFRSERPPAIQVQAERCGDEWRFSVRDNGIGIEPPYFERIFGLFQRLHKRSAYPGTGIGLALCKKIVERGGGRIWVESVPGQGSTFYFTLPRGNGGK